jgi:SanA protein
MLRVFTKKWIWRGWLPLFIFALGLICYCHCRVEKNASGRTFDQVDSIPYNRVGLLLGTCKTLSDKKTINPYWQYRLDAAIQLFKAGKISRILVSGDNGWHGYNEPQDFQDALLELGVPDSVIICDYAGFRTHDSVIRAKKVFGQGTVTLISQQFHNERALMIADEYGLKAVGFNAEMVPVSGGIYTILREALARVLLHADLYILQTPPHFIGKPVRIN